MSDEKVSSMKRLELLLCRYVAVLLGESHESAPMVRDPGSHVWELPVALETEARH
jgi:hypothetical protein